MYAMAKTFYKTLHMKFHSTMVLSMIFVACTGCISQAMEQVNQPREGKPLNMRVAVVYSCNYQINLFGLERLHPFDINKYAKIKGPKMNPRIPNMYNPPIIPTNRIAG